MTRSINPRIVPLMVVALFAASAISPAEAEDGFYAQLGTGIQSRKTAVDEAGRLTFENGYNLNGALGYRMDRFRFELEGIYLKNETDTVDPFLVPIDLESASGNVDIDGFFLNALYEIPLSNPAWGLYGGAGIGTYKVNVNDLTSPTMAAYDTVIQGESDWELAWQLKAGVTYQVSPKASLFAGYRYFRGTNLAIEVNGPPWVDHPNDPEIHNFEFGGRLLF